MAVSDGASVVAVERRRLFCDWGSSRLRAFLDLEGVVLDRRDGPGINRLGADSPAAALSYSLAGERARQEVNDWIRHRAPFDGVVDFDAALRDPAHQARLRPDLDSGDHLHPNDKGYRVMAAAVPVTLLGCLPSSRPGSRPD